MAQTYKGKGTIVLTKPQFYERERTGNLETGVQYMIVDENDNEYATKEYAKQYTDKSVINPNILINGDFSINQEGKTSYSNVAEKKVKTVDMFLLYCSELGSVYGSFDASTKVLTNLSGMPGATMIMQQSIEDTDKLWGNTLTLSAKINGTIYSVTDTLPNSAPASETYYLDKNIATSEGYPVEIRLRYDVDTKYMYADIILDAISLRTTSITLGYVKLEYGFVATKFIPPLISEELTKCERYYKKMRLRGCTTHCGNTSGMLYFPIYLPTSMRNSVSISYINVPKVVGKVQDGGNTEFTVSSFSFDSMHNGNLILIKTSISSAVQYALYSLNDGDIEIDANIY